MKLYHIRFEDEILEKRNELSLSGFKTPDDAAKHAFAIVARQNSVNPSFTILDEDLNELDEVRWDYKLFRFI